MEIEVKVVNAFVDNAQGGNPAGVVLDADALSPKQKQVIAAKTGYSETAFVSKSNVAEFKLDFFTPTRQIAHCGHATIATFSYLQYLNRVRQGMSSKETIDGTRKIIIQDDAAYMEQLAPTYIDFDTSRETIAHALGIRVDAFDKVDIVHTGNAFMIVQCNHKRDVASIKPDLPLIQQLSEEHDLIGFYVFTSETEIKGRHASTRMFAPRYGIAEESATGMAAGPLACFLHDKMELIEEEYLIEQGHFMNPASPSVISVKLAKRGNVIDSLMAGGKAIVSNTLQVSI